MRIAQYIVSACLVALGLSLAVFAFAMLVNCIYVPGGHSLQLQYRGPLLLGRAKPATAGQYAQPGEVGVLEELRGPGRHFYCPIWWQRTIVKDVVIKPGEVAVVKCNMGEELPSGEFLVNGELSGPSRAKFKGTLRKVLGPGRYRINPYGFVVEVVKSETKDVSGSVKHSGWVQIPTGYVGVVTNLASDPKLNQSAGIQADVLPPGLYPVNPKAQQIDKMEVGFFETSIAVDHRLGPGGKELLDASGEPEAIAGSGIGFPSNDGFNIQLDFTAVWGVMPKDAPEVVRTFGNKDAAEQKVIIPQSESISRINGSKMGATELLVGETRQRFQTNVSDDFQEVLKDKHLTLLYGLVRHIYIPKDIRQPLQEGYVADEMKLTREEERTTKQAEGELREAEKTVLQAAEKVKVETTKLAAEAIAGGQKQVGEIEAATKQQVAVLEKQIAEFDAKKTETLGKAKAQSDQLRNEATSQKFALAVKAFGNANAYSKWQFAEGLPADIQLQLFYAGEGTLWTDLKGIVPTLPLVNAPASPRPAKPATLPANSTAK